MRNSSRGLGPSVDTCGVLILGSWRLRGLQDDAGRRAWVFWNAGKRLVSALVVAVDDFVASVVGCLCCALISFDYWQKAMQVVLRE